MIKILNYIEFLYLELISRYYYSSRYFYQKFFRERYQKKAKEVILPLVESGKEVHLNLKDVSYMDSSGISVLIESHQKALENNTKVVIKEVSKSVLKVIMNYIICLKI